MPEYRPADYATGRMHALPSRESRAQMQLKRLDKHNSRQREELTRERIPTSAAATSIVQFCDETKDYMVPAVWGRAPKTEDPYAPVQSGGCCSAM